MSEKIKVRAVDNSKPQRLSQVADGAKDGVLKGAIDKLAEQFVDPIVDYVQPMLNNLHAGLQVVGPAFRIICKAGILLAAAEVIEWMGPALAKIPGLGMSRQDAIDRCKALARWIRRYVGEDMGVQLTEAVMDFLPVGIELIKSMDLKGMLEGAPAQVEQEQQQAQEVEAH